MQGDELLGGSIETGTAATTGGGDAAPFDRTEMIDEDDGPEAEDSATNPRGSETGVSSDPDRFDGGPTRMTISSGGRSVTVDADALSRLADRMERANEPRANRDGDRKSTDPRGPMASAGEMLNALKVARKAAPKKETEECAVAYLVVACDRDRSRIVFSGRDGNRWHTTFVPLSDPTSFATFMITLEKAKELAHWLASSLVYPLANVRFRAASGSDLVWHITYGPADHDHYEVELASVREEPKGWRPPPFLTADPGVAAITTYDAKAISQATSWPGGGAIVPRDEVDTSGLRHITVTTLSGDELLHAVIVPFGQTAGLPEDRQTEINGTLSPPRVASPDGKWRLERANPGGVGWHTVATGTQGEVGVALVDAKAYGPGHFRIVDADGRVVQEHAPVPDANAKAEAKRVSAPGKKVKPPPIVHRGGKPAPVPATQKQIAKADAKVRSRGKGKRS